MNPQDKGFTETRFDRPFPVTLFPNDGAFNPTSGLAVGVETCNAFGTKRLIARYTAPVIRKVSNRVEYWPNETVYVPGRSVEGWTP